MKVKFVSQPFLTNGSGFIHQRWFLQNWKIHLWPNYARYEKMLRAKIIHLKEAYKFCFDHFLEKRTVFILVKKTLLKIKSCGFRRNNGWYEKMLQSKIVHLKKIYNLDFDYFLIKRTVVVLIVKNVIKNQKFHFPDKFCDIRYKCEGTKLFVLKRSTNFILTIFW